MANFRSGSRFALLIIFCLLAFSWFATDRHAKNRSSEVIVSSADPSTVGEPVAFTATVTGPGATPTGKVDLVASRWVLSS
jgi:hypothetical protein